MYSTGVKDLKKKNRSVSVGTAPEQRLQAYFKFACYNYSFLTISVGRWPNTAKEWTCFIVHCLFLNKIQMHSYLSK